MLIIFVLVITRVLGISYIWIYNSFQDYIIRINEVEVDIDAILRKRYDLLNKSIEIIKANIEEEETVLEIITNLRSQKTNNFELDRLLYDAINEFNRFKELNNNLKKVEGFVKIDLALNESEAEIDALRKYYNDTITDYNKMIKVFPSLLIAKLCHYDTKLYYDGKDLNNNEKNEVKI